jgi:hypothetical protein
MTTDEREEFLKEHVIKGGLLAGAFAATGVDPEPTSIGILFIQALKSFLPDIIVTIFIIILTLIGFGSFIREYKSAYQMGKKFGFLCIILAWACGFMLIKYPTNAAVMQYSAYLAVISMILGYYAVK